MRVTEYGQPTLLGRPEKVGLGTSEQVGRRLGRLELGLGSVRRGLVLLLLEPTGSSSSVLSGLLSEVEVSACCRARKEPRPRS